MVREQERDELHRTIWKIANDLRGSVDGWDFKTYVLGMLFYRFISKNRARIFDAYNARKDEEYFAKLVRHAQIKENDYNISVSSYITKEDTREVVNITELNAKIEQIVARQQVLRRSIDEIVADLEGGEV